MTGLLLVTKVGYSSGNNPHATPYNPQGALWQAQQQAPYQAQQQAQQQTTNQKKIEVFGYNSSNGTVITSIGEIPQDQISKYRIK